MAYGNRFFLSFKNRQNVTYTCYILEKDYVGAEEELEGGPDPFILEYQSGDEQPWLGIRASAAKISFYNNGSHPLSLFASNNDDQFKVELYEENTELRWTGVVVQDDSSEPMVKPSRYLVTLQATDAIGILKDVTFEEGDFAPSMYEKVYLIIYLEKILPKTGLTLPINTYCNVYENGMVDRTVLDTSDPFLQSMVDTRTFLKDEAVFEDLYTVLDKMLKSWKCALFQANGEWHIVRWPEAKDFNNSIPGTRYPDLFLSPEATTLNDVKAIGLNLKIEPLNANHVKSLIRSVKRVQLTYNYEFPSPLIRNYNFTELGALITSYASGTDTIKEYEMPYWFDYPGSPVPDRFIRVTISQFGEETGRIAVIRGAPFDSARSAKSSTFEANYKDRLSLGFEYRTSDSQPGNVTNTFAVGIFNPLTGDTYYARNDGTWTNGTIGWTYNVPSGDNTNEWHSVSIDTGPIPFDGLISYYLNQADLSSTYNETQYRNVSLTYTAYINDSTQITGHVHTSTQAEAPKKNFDETVYIDDAPKNAVKGVMFLTDEVTKTSNWHRGSQIREVDVDINILAGGGLEIVGRLELYPLFALGRTVTISGTAGNNVTGSIIDITDIYDGNKFEVFIVATTTNETAINAHIDFGNETFKFGFIQKIDTMFLNDETRVKVEGDYFGLKDTNGPVSLLTIFTVATLTGKYFILGPVSFNYIKATWSGSLEELWNDTEQFNYTNYTNTFKYLYRNR